MTEIRCKKCKRLLFKTNGLLYADIPMAGAYIDIEARCPKCKYIVIFNIINKLQGDGVGNIRPQDPPEKASLGLFKETYKDPETIKTLLPGGSIGWQHDRI